MKSIKKYLFIMAALAAVFGFVACSDEDDDPSTVAVYETEDGSETITFFDDDTWTVTRKVYGKETTIAAGTYAGGNPSKNGSFLITMTKMLYNENLIDVPLVQQEPEEVSVISGKTVIHHTTYIRQ